MSSPLKSIERFVRRRFVNGFSSANNPMVISEPLNLISDVKNPKILWLRQDRIGDVLVSTPLLSAIRETFPDAHITMLLSTNNSVVEPLISEFVNDAMVYSRTTLGLLKILRTIRKRQFDIVVDLLENASATSSILVAKSGAGIKLGVDKENRGVYTHVVPLLPRASTPIEERIAQLLLGFGLRPEEVDLRPRVNVAPEPLQWARQQIRHDEKKRYLGVVLSGSMATKSLPMPKLTRILNAVNSRYPETQCVIFGAPNERENIVTLAEATKSIPIPATENLQQYAALLNQVDMLFTPDTAMVHMAAAWGTPMCVLYLDDGEGRMLWKPHGTHLEAVVSETFDIADIPDEQILDALDRLIIHTTQLTKQ